MVASSSLILLLERIGFALVRQSIDRGARAQLAMDMRELFIVVVVVVVVELVTWNQIVLCLMTLW